MDIMIRIDDDRIDEIAGVFRSQGIAEVAEQLAAARPFVPESGDWVTVKRRRTNRATVRVPRQVIDVAAGYVIVQGDGEATPSFSLRDYVFAQAREHLAPAAEPVADISV